MSLEHPFLGHFAAWDSSAKHLHPQPQMSFPVALARPRVGLLALVTSEVHGTHFKNSIAICVSSVKSTISGGGKDNGVNKS